MQLTQSIYELLTNQEDARACRDIPDAACRASPGNFLILLGSYFLTKLGDAIANPKTVLAWVMSSVGAPAWMLGLLVPIRESGSLLPQLLIASFVRRLPVRKWVWVGGSVVQALTLLGIGSVVLVMRGSAGGWTILALLVVFSLARGLCSVAAKDVVGKTIPKGRRGQLNGWSASAAGLLTVGLGLALLYRDRVDAAGTDSVYALALLGAAGLWLLAAALYAGVNEIPGETDGGENALSAAWARLGLLLRDLPFRRFVIARSLLLCSALTAPYFVALGQAEIGADARVLGMFIAASGFASLVSAPLWGRATDRSSRQVMVFAALLSAGAGGGVAVVSWLAADLLSTLWLLPSAYFVLSVAHAGVRVGRKTYVIDLASGNQRTDYVAVSNSVIGVVLLATGLIGALASVLSFGAVIAILASMGAAGALCASRLPETG